MGKHSAAGLEMVETRSGSEFLDRLRDAGPDLIVIATDSMGPLSFAALLEQISEVSPDSQVVALGSKGDTGRDGIRRLEEGAADYLPLSHLEQLPFVVGRLRRVRETADVTAKLREEAQQAYSALVENQKLIAIGRLAASIAHEINNPLESITNLLYLLRTESSLSPNAENYVDLAEREMERVAQISRQTLNFYRETRTPVEVSPAELLDEVLVLYSRRIEERRIEVVRQYRTDASLVVFPGEMRQVLLNLVTNAIEASPVGGKLVLRVSRARKWSEGISGVRIVIADNGCGIPADTRQHIGELFYTTKGQRGTGLGLWVTRTIIQRYGGELRLYSSTQTHRHGTCFSIFLPANMRPRPVVLTANSAGTEPASGPHDWRSSDRLAVANEFHANVLRNRDKRRRRSRLAAS